jgi:hypothetical protein
MAAREAHGVRLDVREQLELLVSAEGVLARAFDGLAASVKPHAADDVAPQAWYAADVCRRHIDALAPHVSAHSSPDHSRPNDVPSLPAEDLLLLASLVALAWDMVGTAAWATADDDLGALVERCSEQTHRQLDWLMRRLYYQELPGSTNGRD